MFTKLLFEKVSWVLLVVLGLFAVSLLASCGKTYEIHASSDSINGSSDVQDLDVQDIQKDGVSIPLSQWKQALASGDYTVHSVASPELRRRLSEEGR
jgi:hypothetical protein